VTPPPEESGTEAGRGLSFGSIFLTVVVATALVVGAFLLNRERPG